MLAALAPIFLAVAAAAAPVQWAVEVAGAKREAIVYAASKPSPAAGAPLILVFHGHGGRAQGAARKMAFQDLWPEAVVAYLQGIPGTPGIADPQAKQAGWQKEPGELGGRDIKFFDAALERLMAEHKIDPNRVYVVGHSNGGRFVNVLWRTRGDRLAAICSAAGQGGTLIPECTPKPIFIIMGEKDRIVPIERQEKSVGFARALLKADAASAKTDGSIRSEGGPGGMELQVCRHPNGHDWQPRFNQTIVDFFKRHPAKEQP